LEKNNLQPQQVWREKAFEMSLQVACVFQLSEKLFWKKHERISFTDLLISKTLNSQYPSFGSELW